MEDEDGDIEDEDADMEDEGGGLFYCGARKVVQRSDVVVRRREAFVAKVVLVIMDARHVHFVAWSRTLTCVFWCSFFTKTPSGHTIFKILELYQIIMTL